MLRSQRAGAYCGGLPPTAWYIRRLHQRMAGFSILFIASQIVNSHLPVSFDFIDNATVQNTRLGRWPRTVVIMPPPLIGGGIKR